MNLMIRRLRPWFLNPRSAMADGTSRFMSVLSVLIFVKIVYISLISLAVAFWSDYDQIKARNINARWFQSAPGPWPTEESNSFTRHFGTWDAEHYLFLSHFGYLQGVKSCAFYPLWPLAIRATSLLTGGVRWCAGMILANVFSAIAWAMFYHLTMNRYGKSVAFWAVVLLITFPGSLFYQFIYSESLFFLLVMLLWYGLEKEEFGLVRVAAFLLPLTRAVGFFVFIPLAWSWIQNQPWAVRRRGTESARSGTEIDSSQSRIPRDLILAPFFGLGTYFSLMWIWTGNLFEGFEAQGNWGVHSIGHLWNFPFFLVHLFQPTTWHDFAGSFLDRTVFLLLAASLPLIWKLGIDFFLWTYVLGILPAMSGTLTSFTRFASCVFPLFIALAIYLSSRKRSAPLVAFIALNLAIHMVLVWRFVNFRWAG